MLPVARIFGMDDRLDAHRWPFTAQIGQINGKKRGEGRFLSVSSPKNDKVGRGPHGGIESLSDVQMLPQKNFTQKFLGVWGLLSRSPQAYPSYSDKSQFVEVFSFMKINPKL